MITRLYSMFDRASAAFGGPIVAVNDAIARRSLTEFLMTDRNNNIARYPGEFDLYHIGSFDTDSGVVTGVQPVMVCRVADLVVGDN